MASKMYSFYLPVDVIEGVDRIIEAKYSGAISRSSYISMALQEAVRKDGVSLPKNLNGGIIYA